MAVTIQAPRAKQRTSSNIDRIATVIGTRLRALRKVRHVTLMELAKVSRVDAATISRIETGQMTGTLECHTKLVTALGAKITDLYEGIEAARIKDAVTAQLPSERKDAYVHEAGKWSMTMLTREILQKKLMPTLLTIEPGGSTPQEEAKVGTERFLYVLEGQLEARLGEQVHHLKRGSSLYLDASIPHILKNTSQHTAKCLSVITPPVL